MDFLQFIFKRNLEGLSPEQAGTPGAADDWSTKDILAHLLAHEERELLGFGSFLASQTVPLDYGVGVVDECADKVGAGRGSCR